MRILIVEPDRVTRNTLDLMLTHANMHSYIAETGNDALDLATLYDYDLITLELNLPDMSGHEVIGQLRTRLIKTPIVVLSHLDDTENKIKAFGQGCDDYVTKPFHRAELISRIRAIVRRSQSHSHDVITTGPLTVNLSTRTVTVDDEQVHLTAKEFAIMEILSLRRSNVLTKETILDHIYGGRDEPELKIIDVFICKLRKRLGKAGFLIETVWGRGYKLATA